MTKISADIIIIGAGIAGLWLHNRLNDMGYHTILIEKESVGGKQTLSSQGIIHGGAKYALNGALSKAASAIGEMPQHWQNCLTGKGDIDLSETKIFTDHQLMWSTQSLSAKIVSFFSSKALSSRITPLKKSATPDFFSNKQFKGHLYQLNEPVIDTTSLIKNLVKKWPHRILTSINNYKFKPSANGEINSILLDEKYTLSSQHIILTSGEGNEELLKQLNINAPAMQRRPLKMILAKSKELPELYAHCIGTNTKPLATITTHKHSDGDNIWYIGGNLAEEGIDMDDSILIKNTVQLFSKIMPWHDLTGCQWATHSVNRAEPAQNNLLRPDTAFIETKKNISIAWPTKLALTPDLSDRALKIIKKNIAQKIDASLSDEKLQTLTENHPCTLSLPLWETLDYSDKL